MTKKNIKRVLIFNPNTSESVTQSFEPILSKVQPADTEYTYWTCPTGPSLIKTSADMYESASHCLPLLLAIAEEFDGFLGACYADHPIVRLLQSYVHDKPVVGIFDASILAAVHLTATDSKFGVVTTGFPFETLLAEGVYRLLGSTVRSGKTQPSSFAGVAASGIGADDLKPEHKAAAQEKVMTATSRLLQSHEVTVICVGGVILAGMEPWIRQACVEELGPQRGQEVMIIEQLTVGALVLGMLLQQQSSCDFAPALR